MTEQIKLECCHADTCLPDYWSGHHLPHIQVPVYKGMTLAEFKRSLKSELNECVQGSGAEFLNDWAPGYDKEKADAWYEAAEKSIDAIETAEPGMPLFTDLEEPDSDDCESVYAFFVFRECE